MGAILTVIILLFIIVSVPALGIPIIVFLVLLGLVKLAKR